jgi:hypothetical protein
LEPRDPELGERKASLHALRFAIRKRVIYPRV